MILNKTQQQKQQQQKQKQQQGQTDHWSTEWITVCLDIAGVGV